MDKNYIAAKLTLVKSTPHKHVKNDTIWRIGSYLNTLPDDVQDSDRPLTEAEKEAILKQAVVILQ